MSDEQQTKKLPRYKCHKEVWALKIEDIEPVDEGGAMITPAENGYAPFMVDQAYLDKHSPEVGGYYVVYEDAYKSFSPAEPFDSGYARMYDQ